MTPESDDDDDWEVILSVTAFGEKPIPALNVYATPQEDDSFRYDIGHVVFDEPNSSARADVLNEVLNEHVALLAPAANTLRRPDVWVRFFLTLPSGAETISADTVRALASVNATLWIDA